MSFEARFDSQSLRNWLTVQPLTVYMAPHPCPLRLEHSRPAMLLCLLQVLVGCVAVSLLVHGLLPGKAARAPTGLNHACIQRKKHQRIPAQYFMHPHNCAWMHNSSTLSSLHAQLHYDHAIECASQAGWLRSLLLETAPCSVVTLSCGCSK